MQRFTSSVNHGIANNGPCAIVRGWPNQKSYGLLREEIARQTGLSVVQAARLIGTELDCVPPRGYFRLRIHGVELGAQMVSSQRICLLSSWTLIMSRINNPDILREKGQRLEDGLRNIMDSGKQLFPHAKIDKTIHIAAV